MNSIDHCELVMGGDSMERTLISGKERVMVRSWLSAALVVSAVLTGAGSIAHAGAGGAAPSLVNGDVNGDGMLDLSDAVYIIQYLYLAGPAPAVAECPGGTTGDVGKVRVASVVGCVDKGVIATLSVCH